MSYYADLDNDRADEREANVRAAERREEAVLDIKAKLMKLSDEKLIDFVLRRGPGMNSPSIGFQVYDVCERLRGHGWSPTSGQRRAIINTAAIAAYGLARMSEEE
jgi:hypothetical protein